MHNYNAKTPIDVVCTSVLLAFFADIKMLNLIILAARPSLSGVMAAMYGTIVLGLFFMGLVCQGRSLFSLSKSHLGISFLCILWYVVTCNFIGIPSVSVSFFCIFTLAAFLIPGVVRIDVRIFLLALLILPSVGVFYINQIIFDSILEEGVLSMGKCYSMLVPVLANLVYLRFFFLSENKMVKLLMFPFTVINIFYLVQMTMFGSRGPVLCVLLLLASFLLIKVDKGLYVRLRKGRILIMAIGMVFLFLFFIPILGFVNDLLVSCDIQLNFIDKFLRMYESGDMSNGRDSISALAMEGFWNSPIFGNGLAQFENNTKEVYPHNFILQLLYDGGIVLAGGVLIPIIGSLVKKIKSIGASEAICLMLLFYASVPGALFSGDLWRSEILWMFFGCVLSKKWININKI